MEGMVRAGGWGLGLWQAWGRVGGPLTTCEVGAYAPPGPLEHMGLLRVGPHRSVLLLLRMMMILLVTSRRSRNV